MTGFYITRKDILIQLAMIYIFSCVLFFLLGLTEAVRSTQRMFNHLSMLEANNLGIVGTLFYPFVEEYLRFRDI